MATILSNPHMESLCKINQSFIVLFTAVNQWAIVEIYMKYCQVEKLTETLQIFMLTFH